MMHCVNFSVGCVKILFFYWLKREFCGTMGRGFPRMRTQRSTPFIELFYLAKI